MASSTTSVVCIALCVFILALATPSEAAGRQAGRSHCFLNRTAIGRRGKCWDPILTELDGREACCLAGGVGWSTKVNGKRCVPACLDLQSVHGDPTLLVDPVTQSPPGDKVAETPNDNISTWSEWGEWTECPSSCGGNVTRTRTCLRGSACIGPSTETSRCLPDESCIVDGEWSSWSSWSACSAPCMPNAMGVVIRQRQCNNPSPAGGGSQCRGSVFDWVTCRSSC